MQTLIASDEAPISMVGALGIGKRSGHVGRSGFAHTSPRAAVRSSLPMGQELYRCSGMEELAEVAFSQMCQHRLDISARKTRQNAVLRRVGYSKPSLY